MMIKVKQEKLTVLHVGTLNKPIGPGLGYGPIETIIQSFRSHNTA
ncbi:MAG: hypothetical protein NUV86_09635 [Candidatus Scalindua sp.]|nr:hypothetical protein [Candidatus Scalindua sp.]MCR4345505.1 hypothetical protein [Candidatus Scalindua sp.]